MEAQEQILKDNGAEELYFDTYTGKKMERPNFDKLRRKLKSGDKLIITKLDRFARSTIEGVKLITELLELDVTIHIVTMGIIDNSPTGKLIYTVLLAVAEFERDMIVERTQEGKRIAKQKPDFKDGRPKKYSRAQVAHAMQLLEKHSYSQVAEMTGISKATLYREHVKYVPEPVEDDGVPGQMNISEFIK